MFCTPDKPSNALGNGWVFKPAFVTTIHSAHESLQMTAPDFRAALAAMGYTQAAFARLLAAHGHPASDVARSVRRWAQIGPPGEVVVILALLRERVPA